MKKQFNMSINEALEILNRHNMLVEDTDELDDADLPLWYDKGRRKDYHKQKSLQRSLKDKIIDAYESWMDRAKTHENKKWEGLVAKYRGGQNDENDLKRGYRRLWGKSFKDSNEMDETEFYRCITVADTADVVVMPSLGMGNSRGKKNQIEYIIDELFEEGDEDVIQQPLKKFGSPAPVERKALFEKANTIAKSKWFGPSDEEYFKMAKNLMEKDRRNAAIILIGLTPKARAAYYQSFLDTITTNTIYRAVTVSSDEFDYETDRLAADDPDFAAYLRKRNYSAQRAMAKINLESPGLSWSYDKHPMPVNGSHDGGVYILVAKNDRKNINFTMTALCHSQWGNFTNKGDWEGDQEVRVLDESAVTILDVYYEGYINGRQQKVSMERNSTYERGNNISKKDVAWSDDYDNYDTEWFKRNRPRRHKFSTATPERKKNYK